MATLADDLIESVRELVSKGKSLKTEYDRVKQQKKNVEAELAEAQRQISILQKNQQKNQHSNILLIAMRLRKMGLKYRNIKNIFKIGTTVLSGGFIPQIILGEYWHTDLDIFTTDAQAVIKELLELNKSWITAPILMGVEHDASYGGGEGKTIKSIYRGEVLKGVYIEIIESKDPIQNIREFDFDFCKCYFDGDSFYALNKQAVITKTCWANKTTQMRIDKYRLRGFTINSNGLQPPFEDNNDSENDPLNISIGVDLDANEDSDCDSDCGVDCGADCGADRDA